MQFDLDPFERNKIVAILGIKWATLTVRIAGRPAKINNPYATSDIPANQIREACDQERAEAHEIQTILVKLGCDIPTAEPKSFLRPITVKAHATTPEQEYVATDAKKEITRLALALLGSAASQNAA